MAIKACLVAVSEYNDIRLPAIPCKNDLYALSSALIKGLNVAQDQITMYGTKGKVLKEEFVGAIVDIVKQCSETDTLIFYFLGHGGSGNIYFTDGAFSLQSLVDCLKNINKQNKQNKLIVLDCCYAGDFVLDGEDNLDNYISIFNNSNCAVLASSRFNETSEISKERGISLYTGFLCDAITYRPLIRKGGKSLEDIINFIYFLSKKWSESDKCEQHPVFRSSLSGTIYFTVEEYHPYYTEKFYTRYFDNQNIRAKAESVDEKHLYGLYYDYDSSFEHGLWGAIRESALLKCNNPAHQYHCVPDVDDENILKSVMPDCIMVILSSFLLKNIMLTKPRQLFYFLQKGVKYYRAF